MAENDIDDDKKNTCVICLDKLTESVGATVPCGHCFHVGCFDRWKKSRLGGASFHCNRTSVKCPMCNEIATSFCRLYLDLGTQKQPNDDDDDDWSTDSEGSNTRMRKGPPAAGCSADSADLTQPTLPTHDTSISAIATGGSTAAEDAVASGDTMGAVNDNPRNHEVEIITIDDDDEVDPRGQQQAQEKPSRDYKQTAKRLRKRVKLLESQKQQHAEQHQALLEKHEETTLRLQSQTIELAALEEVYKTVSVQLDGAALAKTQLTREANQLGRDLDVAKAALAKAHHDLSIAKQIHAKEISDLSEKKMSEVKKMIKEHPLLVQDNQDLEKRLEKAKENIKELVSYLRKNPPPDVLAAAGITICGRNTAKKAGGAIQLDSSSSSSRSSRNKEKDALEAATMLANAKKCELLERKRKKEQDEAKKKKNERKTIVSAQAARMSRATLSSTSTHLPRASSALTILNEVDKNNRRLNSNHQNSAPSVATAAAKAPPPAILQSRKRMLGTNLQPKGGSTSTSSSTNNTLSTQQKRQKDSKSHQQPPKPATQRNGSLHSFFSQR